MCASYLIVAVNEQTRNCKRSVVIHAYFVLCGYVIVFVVDVHYLYRNISQPRKVTVIPKRRRSDLPLRSGIGGFISGLLHGVTVFSLRRDKFKQKLIGGIVRDIEVFGYYGAVGVCALFLLQLYVSALVHVTVVLRKR